MTAKPSPTYDYSDYEDAAKPPPGDNILARLGALAADQLQAEARVAQLEADLKQGKEDLRDICENKLPALMEEAGQAEELTVSGIKIAIKTAIRGSIPKGKEAPAFAWLEKNGHERIIKRQFTIDFGKEEDKWADKFERDCAQRKKPLHLKRKKTVAPQTLQAFVRGQLEEGVAIPMDTFGVFRQKFAKVETKT